MNFIVIVIIIFSTCAIFTGIIIVIFSFSFIFSCIFSGKLLGE